MRLLRKISENREIEDIIAEELNILIYRLMITGIKKKEGGAYEPRTLASCLHSQEKNTNFIHRPRFSVRLGWYSRRLAQFIPIRTSQPASSIYIYKITKIVRALRLAEWRVCIRVCKHSKWTDRKRQ